MQQIYETATKENESAHCYLDYVRCHRRTHYENMINRCNKIVPKVHKYCNSTVLPVRFSENAPTFGFGGCLDENGEYIEFSGIDNSFGGKYEFSECSFMDSKAVYLGTFIPQWGHFLLETCARIWYCLDEEPNVDKYLISITEGNKEQLVNNYREFFELLGIFDRILLINKPIKFKEVIIPDLGIRKSEYYSDEYGKVIDKIIENALSKKKVLTGSNGVFLSRSKWKNNDFGSKTLDSFFKKNGFKIIHPETVRLTDLICLLNSSKISASISGSTAHNLLFLKSGSKAVMLERQAIPDAYFASIYLSRKINYTFIDAHISILPVNSGGGPFIYCYNKYIDRFAKDENMKRKHIEKGLIINNRVRKYLRAYMDTYSKYPPRWVVVDHYDCFKEGYDEAKAEYGYAISKTSGLKRAKYLPFMIKEYILSHFIK